MFSEWRVVFRCNNCCMLLDISKSLLGQTTQCPFCKIEFDFPGGIPYQNVLFIKGYNSRAVSTKVIMEDDKLEIA